MPVLRTVPGVSLGDLHSDLRGRTDGATTEDLSLNRVEFQFNAANPFFRLGSTEVPATPNGLQAFGDFLGVPTQFSKRLQEKVGLPLVQELFTALSLASETSAVRVTYTEGAVQSVSSVNKVGIQPFQVVDVARRVLNHDDSEVVRLIDTPSEFQFDVRVPEGSSRGVGGDVEASVHNRVGDVTAGGLRFGLDIKHGHAPEVQPFLYRLVCTNGMSTVDDGLKVDARGQSVEEVLADIEAQAERAFSRVERQIQHFYDLRQQRVENPERELRAIAREQGIPDRSLVRLLDLAATDELPDNPTRFDLVNLVTNLANNDTTRNNGGRLLLENAGGAVIGDEAARCGHCRQRTLS